MFKNDGLFGKFDDGARKDPRAPLPPTGQSQPPAARAVLAELPKPEVAATRASAETKGSKLIVGAIKYLWKFQRSGVPVADASCLKKAFARGPVTSRCISVRVTRWKTPPA